MGTAGHTIMFKKSGGKKKCSKFFEKNKIRFFCRIFHQKCVLNFSKGRQNSQEKILSSFWDILKIPNFFSKNRKNHRKIKLLDIFWTNKIIFFEFFTENVFEPFLRGREIIRKNYGLVFEIFLKYKFFSQKIEKITEKIKLFEIFWKKCNLIFFQIFHRKCLLTSSKGKRNNQEK